MKIRILSFFICCMVLSQTDAQKWNKVENSTMRNLAAQRAVMPTKYDSYQLDFADFEKLLSQAPKRFESREKGVTINWPMPGGKMQKFTVKRSDVFHPDLAAKYPKIKAFTGHSESDPTAILKISMSHKGIEGMLLSNRHETIYLDRYLPKSKEDYLLYQRSNYHRTLLPGEGTCTVEVPDDGFKAHNLHQTERFGDCQLRKYRLALACTGEYATFHGGNIPDVLAEYNASMIRVNGIYERDFTITMEIMPESDQLVFLNASTDPYTNNDASAMLGQNQAAIDQIIGFENYDIGHVYGTGGGGIASLRSPCTSRKARGVTGLSNPTGDPFWVDYVSHEMGHQFGGNHTQNNSCQRSGNTSVEPGSASTIMGYAGICSPNVQNNSDDYFHSVSQDEVANFVVAGNGGCAEILPLDNTAPEIISMPETNQVLPIETPFLLTAEAIDADGDVLTYCWEQIDPEVATMPPTSDAAGGPAFRSFDPAENPTRYFPALPSVLFGINGTTWEVLPSANRDMNFNLTVRDNRPLGGCTDAESLSLSFTDSAGPFAITAPNTFTTWNAGQTETITWDVANTDMAPVSCETVDIILSLDRGQSFDIVIAENVPNDGEQDIVVPFEITNLGRIMVKCSDKAFFDINDRDINIVAPFVTMVSPSAISLCPDEIATFEIDHTVFSDDPFPVNYSLEGLPAGATFEFSPSFVEEDATIILTIDNLTNDIAGEYTLNVIAQGETVTLNEEIFLKISRDNNVPVNYSAPEDGQIGVSTEPLLSWESVVGVDGYEVELSQSPIFDEIDFAAATADNFIFPSTLESQTVYYWRVRGISSCVDPEWQNLQAFQTRTTNCINETQDADLEISIANANTFESTLEISESGTVSDIQVSLNIEHTWIGDLTVVLRAPNNAEIVLFDRPGVPENNFGCEEDDIVAIFSDAAMSTATDFEMTCNVNETAIEGSFQPVDPLSTFQGVPLTGTWTLIITDAVNGDGGNLLDWTIENCETTFVPSGVLLQNEPLRLVDVEEGFVSSTLLEMENNDPSETRFLLKSTPTAGELQKWDAGMSAFSVLGVGESFTQEEVNMDQVRYVLTDTESSSDMFVFDALDDQNRYLANNTFVISVEMAALTIIAQVTDQIRCFGDMNGRIEVQAMGGTPDYLYSLNEGPFTAENIFDNLGPGSYTVAVRDQNLTELTSDELIITEPTAISINATFGDDFVTIEAMGGTGQLEYSLDGLEYSENNTFDLIDGNTYRIHVRDENNCIVTGTEFTYYRISAATISTDDVLCKGDASGLIAVDQVSGGLAPYMYQLNDDTPTTANVFVDLPAGTYTVRIIGSSGSEFTETGIVINEPEEALILESTVEENKITLNASGGTAPYTYSLDGVTFGDENQFTDLADGEYTGFVRDANACDTSVVSIIIMSGTTNQTLASLELYPNPTFSEFRLGASSSLKIKYQIIDITGKLVNQGSTISNAPISVEHLPQGMYLIKASYEDDFRIFKLSKL